MRIPMSLAAVAAAFLAAPAPAQPTSGVITLSRYGVVGDGKTDASAPLRAVVEGLTGPATLQLDGGEYVFRNPVFVSKPYVSIRGYGRGVTKLRMADGTSASPLVFGLREVDAGGGQRPEHRPDAFGILDATIAPRRGVWLGYASNGNGYLGAVCNGAQYGAYRSREWSWSGDGLTVELALYAPDGTAALANTTLIGLGGANQPDPWYWGFDATGMLMVRWFGSDQIPDANAPARDCRFAVPGKGLIRLRGVHDDKAGTFRVWADGALLGTFSYPPGTGFARPCGNLPFWVGPSPAGTMFVSSKVDLPRMGVMAWRVSMGVREDAGNDAGRYRFDPFRPHDGSTVSALLGDVHQERARAVPIYCWPGEDNWARSYAYLGLAAGSNGGVAGCSLSGVTVEHGPVLLAKPLHFRMRDVEAYGGPVGLASLPCGDSFMVDARDCAFSGNHGGIRLSYTLSRFFAVDVPQGGKSYATFANADVTWYGGFLGNVEDDPEVGVDIWGGDYGGTCLLDKLNLDNESSPFRVAAVRARAGLMTDIEVRGLVAGGVAAGNPVVVLQGDARGGDVPTARVSGVKCWTGNRPLGVTGQGWAVSGQPTGSR